MRVRYSFQDHHYLNRLALLSKKNSKQTDPCKIIAAFFTFISIAESNELLITACQAALADKYCWKQGSPGNLFFFYTQLELLIEASFLLYSKKEKMTKITVGIVDSPATHQLPCSLSAAELNDPISVLAKFFEFRSLRKWKKDLYTWLEAGLSDYTVLDDRKAVTILPYYYRLQKLIDACWQINLRLKKG